MALTQKQKVLGMLRAAGKFGVRSDTYLADHIPRAAARICELREDGYEIASEREKQFVRYTLRPSVRSSEVGGSATGPERNPFKVEVAGSTPAGRTVPSMFDPDDCLKWGDAA